MRWTVDGAAGIIALRCQQASGRWGRALARPRTRHPSLSRAARSHLTDNTTHTPRPETISKITTSKSVVHPRCSRCTDAGLDPDEWFPVSTEAARARREAAAALAVCALCPVRAECQALSLRHWDIGQHGVWGGLVAADRARLRRGLAAGRGRHLFLVSGNDGAAAVWLGWWRLVMGQVVR